MSGPGSSLRQVFENTLLDLKGVDVFVYKNWQTEQMSSIEAKAIKERGKHHFEFPLGTRVQKDDVVQIKGSQDFWRVLDTEEEYKFGVAIKLHVRVTKIDQAGNEVRLNSEGRAIYYTTNIQGHNYGGIQQGGQGNVQNITLTNNPDFDRAVAGLIELIRASQIPDDEKDELQTELQSVNKLALKDKNQNTLEKAKLKLDYIKTSLTGTEIAVKSAPYLMALYNFFASLPQ